MNDKTSARTTFQTRLQTTAVPAPHRSVHGSCAWSLPSRYQNLSQPQDGALTQNAPLQGLVRPIDGRLSNSVEAEDARLNGSLRSLARRVMGLNVTSAPSREAANTELYFAEPPARKLSDVARARVPRTQVA